ncbi:hypothetical protein K7432_002793 [Basidiobolus ranarum]|uniref:Uncharacterized protein n=1 Tax=Basidiobolus ranarum TaxID=34480 RepID=A0ABR2X168_9FUNG
MRLFGILLHNWCLFLIFISFVTSQEFLVSKYEATILSQDRILWYFSRFVNESAFNTINLTPDANLVNRTNQILLPSLLVMYDTNGNKINENGNLTKTLSPEDNMFIPTSNGGFIHFYIPLVKKKHGVMMDRYDKGMTKLGESTLLPGSFELFSAARGTTYILLAGIGVSDKYRPYVSIIFFDLLGNVVSQVIPIARNIYNMSVPFQPTVSVVPSPNRYFMVNWASKSASGDNVLRANYFSSPDGVEVSRGFIIATAERTKATNTTDFLMINKCNLLKAGDGHVCIYDHVIMPVGNMTNLTISRQTYSTVFSSTGSQFDLPTLLGNFTTDASKGIGIVRAVALPYGGALLISNTLIQSRSGIPRYIQLYNRFWENHPFENNTVGLVGIGVLANNSVLSLMPDNTTDTSRLYVASNYGLRLDNPPRFLDKSVYGDNPIIKSAYPEQGSQVQIGTSLQFSLQFIQSNYTILQGNISIYEASRPDCPRQTFPVSSDTPVIGDTFNFTLDSYALNLPGLEYYVKVDGGTFQSAIWEPLEGLSPYQWYFFTPRQELSKDEKDDITVQIALITSGNVENNQIATNLTSELVDALPIEAERINTSYLRRDVSGDIYQITIKKVSDSQNRTALSIVDNFQDMLKTKARSPLSKGFYTQTLNSDFGVVVETDLFQANRDKFIILGCVVLALGIIFAVLQRKFPSSDNAIMFVVVISFFDFCTDLLFVILNSGDIRSLRAPSVIFFVVPFCFNMLASTYIIVKEVSNNPLFHEWFSKHTLLTSAISVLAATNPALLFILSSRFCSLNSLSAPFSSRVRYQIMICVGIGILIEDIPQLVIQVIYKSFNGFFKIIPFLAVLSNCIGVVYAIVSQIYNYISWKHDKKMLEASKRESRKHLSAMTDESLRIPESIVSTPSESLRYSRSWIE